MFIHVFSCLYFAVFIHVFANVVYTVSKSFVFSSIIDNCRLYACLLDWLLHQGRRKQIFIVECHLRVHFFVMFE